MIVLLQRELAQLVRPKVPDGQKAKCPGGGKKRAEESRFTGDNPVVQRTTRIGNTRYVPVIQMVHVPPNTCYDEQQQHYSHQHELAHGFPNAFDRRHPTGKSRDLGRHKKHGGERYAREVNGIVQVVGPKTRAVLVVANGRPTETQHTQHHPDYQVALQFAVKYKLRIQIHIAGPVQHRKF